MEALAPLSNLTSLAKMEIEECGSLGSVDLGRLLAHGSLNKLRVRTTPNFFTIGSEASTCQMLEEGLSFLSSLSTDDVAGVLAESICIILSSSLTNLELHDNELENFTKEQDETLQLFTSLQTLTFYGFKKLQCIPAGLHRLKNLKTLLISYSPAIRLLPSLPNSLQTLRIRMCSAIRSLPKDGLPNSLQELMICCCPSIRALPKGGFPSSLQELDVSWGNSAELTRQCRKLIGTIPIVRA